MKHANSILLAAVSLVLTALPLMGNGCLPLPTAENGERISPTAPAEKVAPSDGGGGTLTVTMNDLGKSIRLGVGDSFLLNLSDGYAWTSQTSDAFVLAQDIGIKVAHGMPVTFRTFKAGKATLTAQGDAICRNTSSACTTPSEFFKVEFIVTP